MVGRVGSEGVLTDVQNFFLFFLSDGIPNCTIVKSDFSVTRVMGADFGMLDTAHLRSRGLDLGLELKNCFKKIPKDH